MFYLTLTVDRGRFNGHNIPSLKQRKQKPCGDRKNAEKNLPAFKDQEKAQSRLPETQFHSSGPCDNQTQTPERPPPSFRLNTGLMRVSRRFPRSLIISGHRTFSQIQKKGSRQKGGRVDLFWRISPGGTGAFGFTTRRHLRRAVERNRARRLVREVIRLNRERIKQGYEIVLAWKGPVGDLPYREAEKEVLALLEKAGLLKTMEK